MLNYYLSNVIGFFIRVFNIFPVKRNRVILTAYNGRQFACSPKYIALELASMGRYEVIYVLHKDIEESIPEGIKRVNYKSLQHFFYLMTSKFIIFNSSGITELLKYRKSQILINTWHGNPFKLIGNDIFTDKPARLMRKKGGENTNFFLSSAVAFAPCLSSAMCVPEENILNIGLPRNDVLYKEQEDVKQKVYKFFNISGEKGIVLYAPTYRDGSVKGLNDYGFEIIDIEKVLDAMKAKYDKEFVFLFKAHHDMIPDNIGDNCINASAYKDIQELLRAADVLVTDCSSCMWDFALQYKPGFLYFPDLVKYEEEHPFYSSVATWPYEIALDNDELVKLIKEYSFDDMKRRIDGYFELMKCCENGNATKILIEKVIEG